MLETNSSLNNRITPTTPKEIDLALDVLSAHKDEWVVLGIAEKIKLLDQIKNDLPKSEKRLIDSSILAKGSQYETMAEGEEWAGVALIYRQVRFLRKALLDISKYGKPVIPGKVTTRKNGQVVAQVVPVDWKEKLALPGISAEVWMDPAVSLKNNIPQASFYQNQNNKGKVCAVLGAGNFSAIVPEDFMHKLFVEGMTVALKMNPVNEYLGPIFEDIYACLINAGYMKIIYGGVEETSYLINHPYIDCAHMTGSDRTFEAIVFGAGDEGQERKQKKSAKFEKEFTAELGNIAPVIVVPGPWSDKDVINQSNRIASWLVPNAGCNCLTPRLIIQKEDWEYRTKLNEGIADFLSGIKPRKAYYSGSEEIQKQFIEAHPDALQLGEAEEGELPWTYITNVNAENKDDICFTHEPFTSLFSETSLKASSVVDFINKAVEFANEKVWGTLTISIVVHPKSMKDPEVAAAVERALEDLHYGAIVVNSWGVLAYMMNNALWGGYPGHDIYDVQSGIDFVLNPLMFDQAQKSVTYAEFSPMIDPLLANSSNSYLYFRQNTEFTKNPSISNLMKLMWTAMTIKHDL